MSKKRDEEKDKPKDMSLDYAKGYRDALEDSWEEIMKMATKGYKSQEMQIMVKSQAYASKKKIEEKVAELEAAAASEDIIEADEPEILVVGLADVAPVVSVKMRPRMSYLIKEPKPSRSFEMFQKEVEIERPGLIIARTSPIQIREMYNIGKAQVIWLTMSDKTDDGLPPSALGMDMADAELSSAPSDEYVEPTNLPKLFAILANFLDGQENCIILMEGVEYLISHNHFSPVLRFIQKMNEKVSAREANLVMSLNSNALEPRNYSLIEGEMGQVI